MHALNCFLAALGAVWRMLLLTLFMVVFPALAHASDWQILVVGDVTQSTLPTGHPAWRRVDRAITSELISKGFDVYAQEALQLTPACEADQCPEPSVEDLIALARRTSASIDLVVTYSVTVTGREGAAVRQWQLRLPGRMIDISTSAIVDQWAGTLTEAADMTAGCEAACLREWLADLAGRSGTELGSVLATKLDAYVREYAYRLVLAAFTPAERDNLMRALRDAPDYRSGDLKQGENVSYVQWLHSLVNSTATLKTPLPSGALRERLERAAAALDIPLQVNYEGGEFSLRRDGAPYKTRYFSGVLLPILAAVALWLFLRRRHLLEQFRLLQEEDSPSAGLAFVGNPRNRLLPMPDTWPPVIDTWRSRDREADAALAAARHALQQRELGRAKCELERALAADPGRADARTLQAELPALERAQALVAQAREQIESDPSAASRLLAEAGALDAELADAVMPLQQRARDHLRQHVIRDYLKRGVRALDQGQCYRAASCAGLGLLELRGIESFGEENQRLSELLERARAELVPLAGDARAVGGLPHTRFLVGDEVQLGRAMGEQPGVIACNYQRASRVGKQALLQRSHSGFSIIDQGSTHGTLVADTAVSNKRPTTLYDGAVISLGGAREPSRKGAARLQVNLPLADALYAELRFTDAHLKLLDQSELATVWPSMAEDLQRTWLWFAQALPLYEVDGVVQAGRVPEGDAGVLLSYTTGERAGYRVAPLDPDNPDRRVTLEGEWLSTTMPLARGAQLMIGDVALTLEAL